MVLAPVLVSLALHAAPAPAAPDELTLADALAELERANPTLEQARARAAEAGGVARQAWAPLLPTLAAQGTYLANRDQVIFAAPVSPTQVRKVVIQPAEQMSITGTAHVPLIEPQGWFDVAAARNAEHASDASLEASRRTLRAGFTQAAHASRAGEELVTASEAAVASAEELAASARRMLAAGTAAPLDRLRAETEVVKRTSDLTQARANLAQSRLALGILLGRERPVRVVVPEIPLLEVPPVEDLARAALEARPELAVQRAQVDSAKAQVRSAWARLAPNLSATGAVFSADVPYPTGFKDGWRATVDLVWPIYDGGFRYGKKREAEARLDSALAGQEAQRLTVIQEVSDAARDVGVTRERLRLAESQRGLAAEAAATARRGFEAGVASSLDVIDANDRLFQADVGLADAHAHVAQAAVALDRAVGR